MRTKALLCAAVLAAGIASTMAQSNVYSLNVLGYYNVTVPANQFYMIANQLNTTNNTLQGLIPVASDGAQFSKYNGGYSTFTYDGLANAWDGNPTLNPGEGGFFKNNTGSAVILTFVGEVPQGVLSNNIPAGFSVRSSMVPQAEGLNTFTSPLPVEDGDQVFVYNGGYAAYTYDGLALAWDGNPTIQVGQGFFIHKAHTSAWIRNFTVQ